VLKETLILSKMLTYGAVSTFVEMLSTFGRPASAGDQRIVRAVLVEHDRRTLAHIEELAKIL
jgi:hypothetical protein